MTRSKRSAAGARADSSERGRRPFGRSDDEEDGELALEDRHRRVLEIAPLIPERAAHCRHDARAVGTES